MDFSYLLELAKENDKSNTNQASVSRFSTKVTGAKKVNKASPNVGAIKAILEKKDDAKARAQEEFRKKRDNLLALRAQDRKSKSRVSAMINRTKGASKAVLEDAKDITTARGEEQCDEDDYGYESAMSQQIFSKLANRYANMPDDDKLKFVRTEKKTNIEDIKSRVINSLKKEEEEEMEPRKRKRKHNVCSDDFINDGDAFDDFDDDSKDADSKKNNQSSSQKTVNVNLTNYVSDKHNNFKYNSDKDKHKTNHVSDKHNNFKHNSDKDKHKDEEEMKVIPEKKKEKKKSKPAPPPLSFLELMKMAQQKQTAPIIQEVKVEKLVKEKEKKKEIERPLTAKEKEELEDARRRKLKRLGKLSSENKEESTSDKVRKNGESDKGKKIEEKSKGKSESSSKLQAALEKPLPEPKTIDRTKYFAKPGVPPPRQQPPPKKENKAVPTSKNVPMKAPMKAPVKPPMKAQTAPSREPMPKETKPQKSRDFPPKDLKPSKSRDFPPKDTSRRFPSPDVRRRPQNIPPPPKRGRIESDSEEEYDSEMDDFIDDGEAELDYSSEIRKMFGYDKNRYVDDDEDLDDMEASYHQTEREEQISAKIGLQEDLEDIRREEEEKKRKMMRLKQLKNKGRK